MPNQPNPETMNGSAAMPAARWPWQRSLQNRIILTYGIVFLVVLLLLTGRVAHIIYTSQLADAEHNLELDSFLAANALEDPLSGYAAEFQEYAHRLEKSEDGDEDRDDEAGEQAAPGPGAVGSLPTNGQETEPISQRLQQVAAIYASDTGARVTILDPSGNVMADSMHPINTVQNQLAQLEVQAALAGVEQHDIRPDPFSGEVTIYAAAPIQQGNQLLGIVRLSLPMQTVLAEIWRLLFSILFTSLVALALATALAIWISRRLVRPVRKLETAALAIAEGDLTQQVTVESADEIGALARAFNDMVNELRRLIEQQRLFVANASHELRTPLTNIKLRTETLLDIGDENPELTQRYLAEIDREASRLGRLAAMLLDLSSLEETFERQGPAEPTDIESIVRTVADTMQLQAHRAGIELAKEIPEALPSLHVWPEHLEAILVNLLDNAIKYTPAGGAVRLSVAVAAETCRIRVADTGPGIPAEDLAHIFDRFYQVDKARSRHNSAQNGIGSGAGLGLAIVKTLVEQNDGHIWAESTPTTGTTFTVEFPLPAEEDGAAGRSTQARSRT